MTQNIKAKPVIFTDLDGTLLDALDYSYDKALPTVEYLKKKAVPIIFCSSKTRMEQEFYQAKLRIFHPFIAENGGAIFIPEGYFSFDFDHQIKDGYQIIELGMPYREIRRIIAQLRVDTGVNFKGFGDMSDEEVAVETGLDRESAHRAKQREYDETIKLDGTSAAVKNVLDAIKKAGLNYAAGGRYYGVMGQSDKGKAVKILAELFRRKFGQIKTIGIGDSFNDLTMFLAVDAAFLVQKPDAAWEDINMPGLHKVIGIGPEGWTKAIRKALRLGEV